MRISRARIEELIAEDVPCFDLTCEVLGMGGEPGEMEYFTREDCVLAHAVVDGVQLDKVSVDEASRLVPELKAIDPHLTVIIAGGVNPSNAEAYAATGADELATTAPFTARPVDMSARMRRL